MFRYSYCIVILVALYAVSCGGGGGGLPTDAPNVSAVTPTTGIAETNVVFNSTVSNGTPTSYAWNFGGGAVPDTATIARPEVVLGAAGTYQCSITVSNDGGSDTFNFTLTVSAAVDVDELVESGMEDLLAGDGSAAVASFEEVLATDPDNPEANFGMAYVDLMREANSIVSFLSAENEALFRNVASIPLTAIPLPEIHGESIMDLGNFLGTGKAASVAVDEMGYEELRQEIVKIIGVLDAIVANLDQAANNAPDNWAFSIPEDWDDPLAGSITIGKPDLQILVGTLEFLLGTMHFAVAYTAPSFGLANDEWGDIILTGIGAETDLVDLNGDGFIDLGEIAIAGGIPEGNGVLAFDGRLHLNQTADYYHQAIQNVVDALDLYVAHNSLVGHWAFDLDQADADLFASDWNSHVRAYAQDFADAFVGPTTLVIRPELLEEFPELADDPGAEWSIRLDFGAFITNLPDDLRDFPLRIEIDEFGELWVPVEVGNAFPDTTLLGLFPDGLSQENYDKYFMGE